MIIAAKRIQDDDIYWKFEHKNRNSATNQINL